MKYFSMFTGIGGFEKAIGDKGECIGYSEIDKYAIKTYEEHYDHRNYGDATTINAGELPDFDLLVGGFPCQAFSVAGKRGGFDDTRGTLFFDVARILAEKRPRHLVLENVKGLLSHDSGKTFTTIVRVLTDMGYFVEWQVLNSKDFGVPQNRERVFIVGYLGGEPSRKVFPIIRNVESVIKPASALTPGRLEKRQNGRRFKNEMEPTFTLNTQDVHGVYITNPKMNNYKPNYDESVAITATSYKEPPVVSSIRRLTPVECERLQGFEDNWTLGSDTQRYKQCGNAVTVNVVQAVIGGLFDTV